ncbi:hypothetical protein GQ457_07G013300 [Hibiscus cannabinus]
MIQHTISMIIVQAINAWINILYKKSYAIHISMLVLIAYRFITSLSVISPLTYFDRGFLGQSIFAASFSFASASSIAAISNLAPVVIFILAMFLREDRHDSLNESKTMMETFTLYTWPISAKVIGTIISISGAMITTFYSGLSFHIPTGIDLLPEPHTLQFRAERLILGAALAFGSVICFSLLLIIQTKLTATHVYPVFSTSWLMCSSSSVFYVASAMIRETDWSAWRLHANMSLTTIIFTGIFGFGAVVVIVTWCTRARGPAFVSSFTPLSLIFTTLFGSLLLGEEIHVGSAIVIMVGVYITLWGRNAEAPAPADILESPPGGEIAIEVLELESSDIVAGDEIPYALELQSTTGTDVPAPADVLESPPGGEIAIEVLEPESSEIVAEDEIPDASELQSTTGTTALDETLDTSEIQSSVDSMREMESLDPTDHIRSRDRGHVEIE